MCRMRSCRGSCATRGRIGWAWAEEMGALAGWCPSVDLLPPPTMWNQEVYDDLVASLILLPLMQADLSSWWSPRVVCSDASPGGHGLSYGYADVERVQRVARMAEFKGEYTRFDQDLELAPPSPHDGPVAQKVVLDLQGIRWVDIGNPRAWQWIHREDARAARWGLESCGRFVQDFGARCLNLADKSTAVGALSKGISASRALNAECRRSMSAQLALDVLPFFVWVGTKSNPADRPSAWYGFRAGDASLRCPSGAPRARRDTAFPAHPSQGTSCGPSLGVRRGVRPSLG